MKILQISTADVAGGAEASALRLFEAYGGLGHESWLAVGRRRTSSQHIFEIPDGAPGLGPWQRAWLRLATAARRQGSGRLRRLARYMANPTLRADLRRGLEDSYYPGSWHTLDLAPSQPDVVHCHNLHGDYFDLEALVRLSARVPTILNLRDEWLLTGHCAYSLDCDGWRRGCGTCPHLDTYPAVVADATAENWDRKRGILRRSRCHTTAISEWLRHRAEAAGLWSGSSRVIYNGIDLSVFSPGSKAAARALLGLPAAGRLVFYPGHNSFKNIHAARQAVAAVRAALGDDVVGFTLASGARTPSSTGHAEIMLPPSLAPTTLALAYRAADVYLHVARAEAFGRMVTEALACATPVVATAEGGIPEQITDGETGILVRSGQAESLAQGLASLLEDQLRREAMGRAGAESASLRFSLSRQVSDFLSWYEEIIEDWRRISRDS